MLNLYFFSSLKAGFRQSNQKDEVNFADGGGIPMPLS
jgi:hypothetical protein